MPAWLAATTHIPAASPVTVAPFKLQMLGVLVEKVTGKPDVDVALSVLDDPTAMACGFEKLIDWLGRLDDA